MSKTIVLPITCSCKHQKKFKYTAELAEKQEGEEVISIQVECPFSYEANCVRHLTIKLPPGVQLKNNENILRE